MDGTHSLRLVVCWQKEIFEIEYIKPCWIVMRHFDANDIYIDYIRNWIYNDFEMNWIYNDFEMNWNENDFEMNWNENDFEMN